MAWDITFLYGVMQHDKDGHTFFDTPSIERRVLGPLHLHLGMFCEYLISKIWQELCCAKF